MLVSDTLFSSLHLARARPLELFLRANSLGCVSATLHWVDVDSMVKTAPPANRNERRETRLKTKICLPLPTSSRSDSFMVRDFGIVNSCNGLICLSKSIYNYPVIVCNPFTGECVTIPNSQEDDQFWGPVVSGFGYCPRSHKYKVLRLGFRPEHMFQSMAEVYTVGTTSWRSIGCAPDLSFSLFPTYLNGIIHWVSDDEKGPVVIVAFDFQREQFSVVGLPSHFGEAHKERENLHHMNMGVLGGCLSVCDVTFVDHFDVWVMKQYGDSNSWTKDYVIHTHFGHLYQPLKLLENGDIWLMYDRRELVTYSPVERYFTHLRIHGVLSVFEAITHVPSFLPLTDAVAGDHGNLQIMKASCSEHGFSEGAETLFLVEDEGPRSEL